MAPDFDALITQCLPADVYAYLMPLEVSHEFRDALLVLGVVLAESIEGAVLKRQCEYLAGRYCARACLQKLSQEKGSAVSNIMVGTGKNREPLWPQGIIGSISHSSQFAIAIVSGSANPYLGLGVDIEERMQADLALSLCDQVMSEKERLQFNRLSQICFEDFVTLVFSAKEALFKALFPRVGVYLEFDSSELISFDQDKQCLSFRLAYSLSQVYDKDSILKVQYHTLTPSHEDSSLLAPPPVSWLTLTYLS
jgi:enterobactin synthetase component D